LDDASENIQKSENLAPPRTLPSENFELARTELLSHRTLSRGPGGQLGETLSRSPGGQLGETLSRGRGGPLSETLSRGEKLGENRTLQLGPRQRLIIGADTIVREREVSTIARQASGHITMNISEDPDLRERVRRGRRTSRSNSASFDSDSSLLSQVRAWICQRRETRTEPEGSSSIVSSGNTLMDSASYFPPEPESQQPPCFLLSQSSAAMHPTVLTPQLLPRGTKLQTPLVPHRTYTSSQPPPRSPPVFRTRVRYLHSLGSGCESSV